MSTQKNLFQFFTKIPTPKSSSPKQSTEFSKDLKKNGTCETPKVNKDTPKSAPRKIEAKKVSPISKILNSENKTPKRSRDKSASPNCDADSEEVERPMDKSQNGSSNKKRRRIIIASESDDSEDEYKPGKDSGSSSESECNDDNDVDEPESPKKKKQKTQVKSSISLSNFKSPFSSPRSSLPASSPRTPSTTPKSAARSNSNTPTNKQSKQANGKLKGCNEEENSVVNHDAREWLHETLEFLKDDKIRDKFGKPKSHPNYTPGTLKVPDDFKRSCTPAMKQWWDLKSDYFDTVLFFKVGKFYELYHMDACIGVKELGLIFMKGEWAHSGFPEIAFGRFSECLVERGYKVARVEQTETPQMMEERCKKMHRPTKLDKVVNREVCQITTKGTKTLTYQDETITVNNNFLLALCEKCSEGTESTSEYGICFIDTSIGKFTLGQFQDDRHGSRILTLLALYPAVEILYDKSSLTKKSLQLLDNNLSGATKEALNPNTQFWDSTKVLKFLNDSGYFGENDGAVEWPSAIMDMLDEDDVLHQTSKKEYELAFRSLGACIWYLKKCCIEDCLLTMRLFEEYKPRDTIEGKAADIQMKDLKKHMVLDGVTLQNLEIVPVQASDNADGTLLGTMDYCSTSFGKRLFRNWLCSPLYNPENVIDRQNAVDDLIAIPDTVEDTVDHLKKLPDLERLLSKIHSYGLSRSQDHPDARAIFYESDTYNKTKIMDFLSALEGLKEATKIKALFENHYSDFKSVLLKQCTCSVEGIGTFPDMIDPLKYFENAFDHESAKSKGSIIPTKGVDKDYDSARQEIEEATAELDSYLDDQKKKFGCSVKYVHSGKSRYLLEVPESKKIPSGYELMGSRKGFKRFYTSECKELVATLTAAEESRDAALRDCTRRIFAHFDKDYKMWKRAIHCLATLDALISLLLYYNSSGVPMCRPQFTMSNEKSEPHLEIIDGVHPTFLKFFTGDDYIPNSVYIGSKMDEERSNINNGGKLVLVTGPNMGGKSTLMRQAGTLVIMAHLGSYVPAESMRLTPVDRIFTRVGASDQFTQGESTFFVEASETSSILHNATPDSFVLIDELGRGTSTFDGAAIASATLDYLANSTCCRTLFSTHYHNLVDQFISHPNVGLGHMACLCEKKADSTAVEEITFLYKFVNGACPKSYGFNVALLAGIPQNIVREGFLKTQHLEYSTKIMQCLRRLSDIHLSQPEMGILEKITDLIANLITTV